MNVYFLSLFKFQVCHPGFYFIIIFVISANDFTALNYFISKTVIHRKEKYNTYITANLNGKNSC